MSARNASLLWAVLALSTPLGAQQAEGPRGPTDPVELESFLDGLMVVLMEEHRSAGAVVSVVKDDEIFLAKGYGFADVDARETVDPETTLFRIGSVSKLFTWTTVMQMVEQGRIDLEADVNRYLDFEIPATYPEPVTLADIMAHAGGFEDYVLELFGREEEDVRPLGQLLSEQLPARVRPPGDISSYSNHATGMAAYAVERAIGRDWVDYVEEAVLEPLGMEHTTFRQPLPEHLSAHMSKGYSYAGGRYREEDFEFVPLAPVGAASASGVDMARFMIAHLQLGRLGDGVILEPETARRMQLDHHRMADGVNGMAHGYMVMSANGERIIGHGGDTFWFHSNLALFPEHGLGVFVSFNSEQGGAATGPFLDAFVDRYFSVAEAVVEAPADFTERGARFAGEYRSNRFSHTTLAKLAALSTFSVHVTNEGTLRGLNTEWVEVSPRTFQERHGDRRIVFREDETGAVTHLLLADVPVLAFERAPVHERPHAAFPIVGAAGLAILLTLLAPLMGWLARRWYGVRLEGFARIPRAARLTLRGAAILLAAGLLGLGIVLRNPTVIAYEIPQGLGAVLLPPVLAVLPVLGALFFAVRMWRRGDGRPTARIAYALAVACFGLLLWQMSVWNVLGWRY